MIHEPALGAKFSPDWRLSILRPDATLHDVLVALSSSGLLVGCFLTEKGQPEAIMTDSDIRRALISGAALTDPARLWSNRHPKVAPDSASAEELREMAREMEIQEVPLVDTQGRLSDIYLVAIHEERVPLHEPVATRRAEPLPNAMFILAGGLGSRLRSVVSDKPKPLALVGKQPLIYTLIKRAETAGLRKFFVSVNYMAEKLEEHLAGPEYEGLDIEIIREPAKLGTAGSIGYVAERVVDPLVVCNADVLTTVNYDRMIYHHLREYADMSCAVRPFSTTIPYGVTEIRDNKIVAIREKPSVSHLVNAGIYVVSPGICRTVKKGEYLDMPDLCSRTIASLARVVPFYLHEYWVDIGAPEEFHRANREFDSHFGETNQ